MEETWELATLVMSQNGTEISVNKDGFSIKTDGDASDRLANAALDFLSPITETTGLLGTLVRGVRVNAALKATLRAKKICEENGVDIKAVSPKLFMPWLEGASLEDINDDYSLTEQWAYLLANAAANERKILILFAGFLKSIGHQEVKLLKALYNQVTTDKLTTARGKFGYYADQLSEEETRLNWTSDHGQSLTVFDRGDGLSKFSVQGNLGQNWVEENYSSVLLLKQLGLVDLQSHLDDSIYMSLYLTPIGDEFVTCCQTVS